MDSLTHPGYSRAAAGSPGPSASATPRAASPFEAATPPTLSDPTFSPSADFGSSAHLNDHANYKFLASRSAAQGKPNNRRKWIIAGIVALVLVIAAAVGVGVGVGVSKSKSNSTNSSPSKNGSGGALDPIQRTALTRWDYSTMKTHGVNLGGWLLLELWMDGGFVIEHVGTNSSVIDEWTFMEALDAAGLNKTDIMVNHYNSYITEADIEILYQAGVNKIRLPMGFWMWIPCENDEPFVCQNGQVEAVEMVLPWLAARGIHVDLDLHGLPGAQAPNAQTTGHQTPYGEDQWFLNQHNLNRTMDMVDKVIAWVEQSPYQDIISGLEPANEPRLARPDSTYDQDMAFLAAYYDLVYERLLRSSWKGWMLFHHAYARNLIEEWAPYAQNKSATGRIVIIDHPYAGNFPAKNETSTQAYFCYIINDQYSKFTGGCPILANEYSLVTGVLDDTWTSEYYKMQAYAFSNFSGAVLWSIKTFIHNVVVTAPIPERVRVYSFENMVSADVIPKSSLVNATGPGLADGASPAAQAGVKAYFESLGPNRCVGNFTGLSTTSTAPLGAAATN